MSSFILLLPYFLLVWFYFIHWLTIATHPHTIFSTDESGSGGPKQSKKRQKAGAKPSSTGNISSTSPKVDDVQRDSDEDDAAPLSRFPVAVDSDSGDDSDDESEGEEESELEQPNVHWGVDKEHANTEWKSQQKSRISFYGKRSLKQAQDPPTDPLIFFKFFLTPKLMKEIVTHTNNYAREELQKQADANRKRPTFLWQPINEDELLVWVGLCIGMALEPR